MINEEQQCQIAWTAALNKGSQSEDARDQTCRKSSDCRTDQRLRTRQQRAVEGRFGNAAQGGNTEGSDHALLRLVVLDRRGHSQSGAADADIGNKAHNAGYRVVAEVGNQFDADWRQTFIQTEHNHVWIDRGQDWLRNKAEGVSQPDTEGGDVAGQLVA